MRFWRRKRQQEFCKWEDLCKCHKEDGDDYCQKCKLYHMIDSGYGWCSALPEQVIVAWCKDICSFFKRRIV